MTKRNDLNFEQNLWSDSQLVDYKDLTTEQNYNNSVTSSLVNNHLGQGILLEALEQVTLFDSSLVSGLLDGIGLYAQHQPTDINYIKKF